MNLIKRLYVRGFRRIGELKCEDDALNLDSKIVVFYGPNSSGKSSIIQSMLQLLRHVYSINIPGDIEPLLTSESEFLNVSKNEMLVKGEVAIPDLGYHDFEIGIRMSNHEEERWFKIDDMISIRGKAGEFKIYVGEKELGYTAYLRVSGLPPLLHFEISTRPLSLIDEKSIEEGLLRDDVVFKVKEVGVKDSADTLYKLRDLVKSLRSRFTFRHFTPIEAIQNYLVKYLGVTGFKGVRDEAERFVLDSIKLFGVEFVQSVMEDLNGIVEPDVQIDILIDEGKVKALVDKRTALGIDGLSDGLVNLMRILFAARIMDNIVKSIRSALSINMPKALLILDTPESNIHVDWLVYLLDYLLNLENLQVMIETHSGLVVSHAVYKGLMAYYVKPEGNTVSVLKITRENINSIEMFSRERDAYARAIESE